MLHLFIIWCGFFLPLYPQGSKAMRDARISVPLAVKRGDDATLECFFDMEGDQLYAVKWYLGTTEFYRYTPKEIPPIKQFPTQSGLIVRESHSNANRVVLERVPMSISGRYSCEVSADAPSFYTSYQTGHLQVVDLPETDPFISGIKTRYHYGDILKANCTSGHSNPAVNLTWMINGIQADRSHFHNHKEKTNGGQYMSQSSLRLKITKQLFTPRLKIRCVASMYDVYYKSNEKSIEAGKKRHPHNHFIVPDSSTAEPSFQWELVQIPEEPRPESTLIFHHAPSNAYTATRAKGMMRFSQFHSVAAIIIFVSMLWR